MGTEVTPVAIFMIKPGLKGVNFFLVLLIEFVEFLFYVCNVFFKNKFHEIVVPRIDILIRISKDLAYLLVDITKPVIISIVYIYKRGKKLCYFFLEDLTIFTGFE